MPTRPQVLRSKVTPDGIPACGDGRLMAAQAGGAYIG